MISAILAAAALATTPVQTTRFPGSSLSDVALRDGLLVVNSAWSREDGICCFDVSDPAHPRFAARFPARGYGSGVPVFLDDRCYVPQLYCGYVLDVSDPRQVKAAGFLNPRFPKAGCRSVWIEDGKLKYETFENPRKGRRKKVPSAREGDLVCSLEEEPVARISIAKAEGDATREVASLPYALSLASVAVRDGVAYVYSACGATHALLTLPRAEGLQLFTDAVAMPKLTRQESGVLRGTEPYCRVERRGNRLYLDDGLGEIGADGKVRIIRPRTLPAADMSFDGTRVAVAQGIRCRTLDYADLSAVRVEDFDPFAALGLPTGTVQVTGCALAGADLFVAYSCRDLSAIKKDWRTCSPTNSFVACVRGGKIVGSLATPPCRSLLKLGNFLYATGRKGDLLVIDAANPRRMRLAGTSLDIYDRDSFRVKEHEGRVFCLSGRRVCELDMSDARHPRVKGFYHRGLGVDAPSYDDFCFDGNRLYALAHCSLDEFILDDPQRTETADCDTGRAGRLSAPVPPLEDGAARFEGHVCRDTMPKGVVLRAGAFSNALGCFLKDWTELPDGNFAVAWGEGGFTVCGSDGRTVGELPRGASGWVAINAVAVRTDGGRVLVKDDSGKAFAVDCTDPRHPRFVWPWCVPAELKSFVGDSRETELRPGVGYRWLKLAGWREKTNEVHAVRIDLARAKVRPYIYERAGRVVPFGRPSVAAKEKNALFTVNGGFFAWKNPVPCGTHKCGGRTWHGDFGAGRRFGLSFRNDGSEVAIRDLTTNEFAHVDNFISGATWLTDGKPRGAMSAKPDRGPLAPRTFVGARNGEFLVVMTSDGRQPGVSDGLDYAEGAELLRQFGCEDGFFLDGGGSTVMAIREDALKGLKGNLNPAAHPSESAKGYIIMNRPSDGNERAVLDHLMFIDGV